VFLHGLPGVGKLTIGKALETLTGYPVFHNHLAVDLATTLFEFGSPEFVEFREHIWLEAFARTSEAGLPGLIFTFADERSVPAGFAGRVVDAVESRGGQVCFVELVCEPAELSRRVEDPGRRRHGKLASAELLSELLADGTLTRLELPADYRQCTLDTTHSSPDETAVRFVEWSADG